MGEYHFLFVFLGPCLATPAGTATANRGSRNWGGRNCPERFSTLGEKRRSSEWRFSPSGLAARSFNVDGLLAGRSILSGAVRKTAAFSFEARPKGAGIFAAVSSEPLETSLDYELSRVCVPSLLSAGSSWNCNTVPGEQAELCRKILGNRAAVHLSLLCPDALCSDAPATNDFHGSIRGTGFGQHPPFELADPSSGQHTSEHISERARGCNDGVFARPYPVRSHCWPGISMGIAQHRS